MPRSTPTVLDVASLVIPGLYGVLAALFAVGGLADGTATARALGGLAIAGVLLALTVLVWRIRAHDAELDRLGAV